MASSFVVLVDSARPLLRWQSACLEVLSLSATCLGFWVQRESSENPPEGLLKFFVPSLRLASPCSIPHILTEWPEDVDFALSFCQSLPSPALASKTDWGIWQFDFGHRYPGLQSHCLGHHTIHSSLVKHSGEGEPELLYESHLATQWNLFLSMENVYSACPVWVTTAVKKLLTGAPITHWTSLSRTELNFSNLFKDSVRRVLAHLRWELFGYDIWNIGMAPHEEMLSSLSLERAYYLPPHEPLHFIADPFVLNDGTLLVEEASHLSGAQGRICRVDPNQQGLDLAPVLMEDHHLSYPYILQLGEDEYCIPEAHRSDKCSLYKIANSGYLELERDLLEGLCIIDPTPFFHEGRWWLFFTDKEPHTNARLYAYFADSLEANWRAHALNPIKEDIRASRPAGPLFYLQDKLYRPSQDCSETYGGAVTINEITKLTPNTFQETSVMTLRPNPNSDYPDGIHHLVLRDKDFVFDAKRSHFDLLFPLKKRLLSLLKTFRLKNSSQG